MNIKQLEVFLWVAELQSFTKAAHQLYMSQPAVSFQIKALEENLQVALFKRGDKKVTLTEAGRLLYHEARQILRYYRKIRAGLDDLKGLKTGQLVVGASTTPGEYILPLLIGGFKERYPGIKVTLQIAGSIQVGQWVQEREIDLGVTGTAINRDGINCLPWILDRLVLIVPPQHRWTGTRTIDVSELKKEFIILREPGSGTRRTLKQKLAQQNIVLEEIPVAMELGSTRAVITAVKAGLGVSIVSRYAVKEVLELELVKEVPVTGIDLDRYLFLVYNKQELGEFAVEAFIKFISDQDSLRYFP